MIKGLTEDLNFDVEIVPVDTGRAEDGLALSSRNQYLSAAERDEAPRLSRELKAVAESLAQGSLDYAGLRQAADHLTAAGWVVDYVEIRRADTLEVARAGDKKLVVLAAARPGTTRLIDNLEIKLLKPQASGMPSEADLRFRRHLFFERGFANLQTILLVIKLRLIICRLKRSDGCRIKEDYVTRPFHHFICARGSPACRAGVCRRRGGCEAAEGSRKGFQKAAALQRGRNQNERARLAAVGERVNQIFTLLGGETALQKGQAGTAPATYMLMLERTKSPKSPNAPWKWPCR